MHSLTSTLLLVTTLLVLLPAQVTAFGAGDIPDFSYLNDKAFRHGDIENILTELAKTAGSAAAGGGILHFAQSLIAAGTGGSKFSKGDVKKVYFGNWLRDYSQAMDIAGLSKLSADTLVLIVAVLGFMTFGFATEEFEVTPERLGVYLPVEHIDNPKGYAEKEGDARRFHPRLRPPVNPQELEIDPRTGMKNYMASENRGWDTSTAHIRRTLRACIERGRRAQGREGDDLWEAYRLLGTGLHTLEDLLAHSNWCEIALRKLGHEQVFCHVGDRVIINTPNGPAPPIVTGTFGGADFLHSLMGEATDHLSQASVTDLSQKMNDASNADQAGMISTIKNLLSKIPHGGGSSDMDQAESLQAESKAYSFNPNNVAPPEVQQKLWALLKWRDGVFRSVSEKIERIPGLETLIDNLTDALNAYVYTILAPWLSPILQNATSVLGEGSKAVIDSEDQYEVFDNPRASDPSHSLLSKDHFGLILNEAAGKVAQVVVQHSVKSIVNAWFDRSNPDQVIDQVLESFHHPYYNVGRSQIQNAMFQTLERWVNELENRDEIIEALTKESVRAGKNKRPGSEDETAETPGGSHSQSQDVYRAAGQFTAPTDYLESQGGRYRQEESRFERDPESNEDSYRTNSYSRQEETGYGQGRRNDEYSEDSYGSRGYGAPRTSEREETYGQQPGYSSSSYRQEESYERPTERPGYGGGYQPSYGAYDAEPQRDAYQQQSYSSRPRYEEENPYSRRQEPQEAPSWGASSERQSYGEEQPSRYRQEEVRGQEYGGYSSNRYEEEPRSSERRQEYDEGSRGGYRAEEAYGRTSYGNAQDEGGYGGSRGYQESEETFGAERLNLGERDEYDRGGEEPQGYGGRNEYEAEY